MAEQHLVARRGPEMGHTATASTPPTHLHYSWLTDPLRMNDTPRPLLFPTPPERLCDARGRPYFLWDSEMTLDAFRAVLADPDPDIRAAYVGKLMRQAKPDDVFEFVRLAEIVELWPRLERYLGRERAMWRYLLDRWGEVRRADIAAQ